MSTKAGNAVTLGKPVILYGAGNNALSAYKKIRSMGMTAVCYVDSDAAKHTGGLPSSRYFDLPIVGMEYALSRSPDCLVYVTPNPPVKYDIIENLISVFRLGPERIINYEPYVKCVTCAPLSSGIVFEKEHISLCCHVDIAEEQTTLTPKFDFAQLDNQQILDSFLALRKNAAESLNKGGALCKGCHEARRVYAKNEGGSRISSAAFGTGFVCQIQCIYCSHHQQSLELRVGNTKKILGFWKYLETTGLIDRFTNVGIANGEISINPLFDEIMDSFWDYSCEIATNGVVFKDRIAEKLEDRSSKLNVSLDSGTPETYHLIKRGDFYHKVRQNIREYSKHGNITLKYILIPGKNDRPQDIDGFLNFASEIGAVVILSRDFFGTNNFDRNIEAVIKAVTHFMEKARALSLPVTVDCAYRVGVNKDRLENVFNSI